MGFSEVGTMRKCEFIVMECLRVEENIVSVPISTNQEIKVPS